MALNPITRFAIRTFLWLPFCFAAWYFSSILLSLPLAELLDRLMTALFSGAVTGVRHEGNGVLIAAQALASQPMTGAVEVAPLSFRVNPLKYGYSIPLYTALVLATPGTELEKWSRWIIGIAILFLAQSYGVAAESIKILTFDTAVDVRTQLGFSAFGIEGVTLAYQFGFLILPSVAPVLIWAVQFRRFIQELQPECRPPSGHT